MAFPLDACLMHYNSSILFHLRKDRAILTCTELMRWLLIMLQSVSNLLKLHRFPRYRREMTSKTANDKSERANLNFTITFQDAFESHYSPLSVYLSIHLDSFEIDLMHWQSDSWVLKSVFYLTLIFCNGRWKLRDTLLNFVWRKSSYYDFAGFSV